jgi:Zn-dependent protease
MHESPLWFQYAVWALPVLSALLLHEVAHGWIARCLGDGTASEMGRLTLNPLRHIDPIGTVLVPLLALLLGAVPFVWLKPVPVDPRRLRHPLRDMALVAVAGPASNLLQALVWLVLAWLAVGGLAVGEDGGISGPWGVVTVLSVAWAGIIVNVLVMVVNLIPIPPLDGSRILVLLLPRSVRGRFERAWPLGVVLLMLLFGSGAFAAFMGPWLAWGARHLLDFLATGAG